MMIKRCLSTLLLVFTTSAFGQQPEWSEAFKTFCTKAQAKEYSYHMGKLSPNARVRLKQKYGDNWKDFFIEEELSSLSYYCGWIKNPTVVKNAAIITITGKHGCFIRLLFKDNKWLPYDFGQKLGSM